MATRKASARASPPNAVQTWLSVVRAYNLCDAVLSQRVAELGLRLGEHEVLVNLLRSPGLTQQQLAERCFAAKSGVSMLVTRMENAGMVQREADQVDARVWRLALTPKGRALADKSLKIQTDVLTAMAAQTTQAELKTISEAMQRASTALNLMRRSVER
jgi:DNA-binding MarR family transcriptional regulator